MEKMPIGWIEGETKASEYIYTSSRIHGKGGSEQTKGGYLLDELDAGGQVHPEVDECPLNAFLLVLLLLQHEHVVVEELLQFLVGEVDAQLLQAVELSNGERKERLVSNASLSALSSAGQANCSLRTVGFLSHL